MTTSLIASFGNTPLLTLTNFSADCGALILGKQESRNPMGSVKCRIAVSMIETAEQTGIINKDTTVIEPTSGNTGLGLAFVCAAKNLKLILTMPDSMSIERRQLLKHLQILKFTEKPQQRKSGKILMVKLTSSFPESVPVAP